MNKEGIETIQTNTTLRVFIANIIHDKSINFVRCVRGEFSGGRGGRAPPHFFCNHLFFCDHCEELQTVLIEAKLIINNATLIYVYTNTIKTF